MLQWILDIFRALFASASEPDEEPRPSGERLREEPEPKVVTGHHEGPIVAVVSEPDPAVEEPEIEDPDVMTIGVWTGQASMRSVERAQRDVEFCMANGIRRLDVIVNDHSKRRTNEPFSTYKLSRVLELVKAAQRAGMEVHFMSWLMPYEKYIQDAAEILVPFCNDLGVSSLQWDAEEPWTQARDGMPYPDAAKLIQESFGNLSCQMGANAIGYTPSAKFGPLVEICDYVVPQCYATSSNTLNPATAVPKLVRRWDKKFDYKKLVIGLAAYRQTGIPNHSVMSAMQASFTSAQAIEGVDAVIYWSLRQIQANASVTRAIRQLASQTRPSSDAIA